MIAKRVACLAVFVLTSVGLKAEPNNDMVPGMIDEEIYAHCLKDGKSIAACQCMKAASRDNLQGSTFKVIWYHYLMSGKQSTANALRARLSAEDKAALNTQLMKVDQAQGACLQRFPR